jgi:hypothetical protein
MVEECKVCYTSAKSRKLQGARMPNVGGCDRRKVATQGAFAGNHDNKILWSLGIIWGSCDLWRTFGHFVKF